MWASKLISIAQNRILRNRGRTDNDDDDHGFSHPSILVTAIAPRSDVLVSEVSHSMPLLFNLCRRWAWPAIGFRCQTHPHEAAAQDENGDTALHWVAFGNPPLSIVEALLRACPVLASKANNNGRIPLHVAASYRATGCVIRALVVAYPESPGVVDPQSGAMALHLMCDHGTYVEGLRAILETDAGAVSTRVIDTIFQQTPLEIHNARKNMPEFRSMIETLKCARRRQVLCPSAEWSASNIDSEQATLVSDRGEQDLAYQIELVQKGDFWHSVSLLVQSEYKGTALVAHTEDTAYRVVHACVGIRNCPSSLVELATLLFPEQLVEQDEKGRIPLHIVLAKPDWRNRFNDIFSPDAAQKSDRNGKFPLQILLESGHPTTGTWGSELGRLVSSHPVALEQLNLPAQLYPFVWAKLPNRGVEPLYHAIRAKPEMFALRS